MRNIICERMTLPKDINIHSHTHAQLLLPLHGSIYIETNSYEHNIDENYLGFLPPKCKHAYKGEIGNEFLVLNIPESMILKNDMHKFHGASKLQFDDRWKAIRYLIMSETAGDKTAAALNKLFQYFYHYITDNTLPDSIKFINENYCEEISIKTLADIEHYNVNYYCEWFRKKTGVPPMEYIKNLRLQKAKELLANTEYTVLQIAEQVGYSFNSSFSRIFKETEGTSPAQYRKKNRIAAK